MVTYDTKYSITCSFPKTWENEQNNHGITAGQGPRNFLNEKDIRNGVRWNSMSRRRVKSRQALCGGVQQSPILLKATFGKHSWKAGKGFSLSIKFHDAVALANLMLVYSYCCTFSGFLLSFRWTPAESQSGTNIPNTVTSLNVVFGSWPECELRFLWWGPQAWAQRQGPGCISRGIVLSYLLWGSTLTSFSHFSAVEGKSMLVNRHETPWIQARLEKLRCSRRSLNSKLHNGWSL